jgi:hypothetical protein
MDWNFSISSIYIDEESRLYFSGSVYDTSLFANDTLTVSPGRSPSILVQGSAWGIGTHRIGVTVVKNGCESSDTIQVTVADNSGFSNAQDDFISFRIHPNPIVDFSTIEYELTEDAMVRIRIFDAEGRETEPLVNQFQRRGRYIVSYDANRTPPGVYYLQLCAGEKIANRKVIVIH